MILLSAILATTLAQSVSSTERPAGNLDGRIVYLHAGHGWTWNSGLNGWFTQRPETFEMVEDFGNQDLHSDQADVLWRAGATIVPLRPIGHQPFEVVIDNDDATASFNGPWINSVSPIYFGTPGDVPYLFASTSPTETAVATYRPFLPAAAEYPVYAWTRHGFDRVNQLYRVHHAGGTTEVRVDHRRVGNGLVYLGTYRFEAGDAGSVEVSNQNNESGVVIADMIRFGNGFGDIDRGGGVSTFLREDEAALYWIEAHAGVGIPSSEWRSSSNDGTATVSAPTRWAEQMNREASGSLSDRVFVSHHSNAANGTARGTIALFNGNNNPSTATPNQSQLALTLAQEINDDLVSLSPQLEHDWADRSVLTLDRTDFEFGEINNQFIGNEFDATIVERAFHDNQLDAELIRDPRVQQAVASSTYQGLVRFFRSLDPSVPQLFLPAPVPSVQAVSQTQGTVQLDWTPPSTSAALGSAATSYRVQVSRDGLAFDRGTNVGGVTTLTLTPTYEPEFYRIIAVNAAGEARPSTVVSAKPAGTTPHILLVDGFDRLDRFQNPRSPFGQGAIDRVRPSRSNPNNTTSRAARAIHTHAPTAAISTTTNERVVSGTIDLNQYDLVTWLLGEESSTTRTLDAFEQLLLSSYVQAGGHLAISGSELAWELDELNRGRDFLQNTLGTQLLVNDAQSYGVTGVSGTEFEGLVLTFDDGSTRYDVDSPDAIIPTGAGIAVATYTNGLNAMIATRGSATSGDTLLFGFPIETITTDQDHNELILATLEFFNINACLADVNQDGSLNGLDFGAWLGAFNAQNPLADQNSDGQINGLDFGAWLSNFNAGCQ